MSSTGDYHWIYKYKAVHAHKKYPTHLLKVVIHFHYLFELVNIRLLFRFAMYFSNRLKDLNKNKDLSTDSTPVVKKKVRFLLDHHFSNNFTEL
jgi:hypothetical protein